MKYNSELAEKILEVVETFPSRNDGKVAIAGYSQEEVSYHIKKLSEEGLLKGVNAETFGKMEWLATDLTLLGHKYLKIIQKENDAKSGINLGMKKQTDSRKIFIVHGHDNEAKETVARFLANLNLEPIILHEQVNKGKTIIEKFEHHSNVGFAVAILTPDDVGNDKTNQETLRPRARQNVVFELGYFFAKLGREKVCALYKKDIDLPSDIGGVIYILMDEHGAWKNALAKEMRAAELEIDMNKI